MELSQLTLRNFCQHRDRVVQFSSGMTAITGPNGCGKSNILAAIQYALLGQDPNHGRITDSINWLAGRKDPAEVVLAFTHGSADYVITRSLRSQPHTLEQLGVDHVITGSKAVTERLLEILGATPALISEDVLVEQGAVARWFTKPPAARAEEIASLLRLDRVERVYGGVVGFINGIEVPAEPTDLASVAQELQDAKQARQQLSEERDRSPDLYDSDKIEAIRSEATTVITNRRRYLETDAEYKKQVQQQESKNQELGVARDKLAELREDVQVLSDDTRKLEPSAEAAKKHLSDWDAYNNSVECRKAISRINGELREIGKPVHIDPPDWGDIQQRIDKSADEVRIAYNSEIQTRSDSTILHSTVVGKKCPTCGQIVTQDSDIAEKQARVRVVCNDATYAHVNAQQYHSRLIAERDDLEALQKEYQGYRDACNRIDELRSQLRTYKGVAQLDPPCVTKEDAQKIVDQFNEQQAAVSKLTQDLNKKQSLVQLLTGNCQAIDAQVKHSAAQVTAIYVSESAVNDAQEKVTWAKQQLDKITELRSKLSQLEGTISQLDKRLVSLQDTLRSRQQILEARAYLGSIRDVLHRDAAPKVLIQRQLEALVIVTNQLLGDCGMPFHMESGDKCQLFAHFATGVVSDRRLSGGERSMLGLIFRMARAATLLRNVGFLSLDEPTEFLDEDNRERLSSVFTGIRELSESAGVQLVVITHDQHILHMFDRVETM